MYRLLVKIKDLSPFSAVNLPLVECYRTRTQNHLVCKWTLNHLAKLVKLLSCVVSTYLYGALDCKFLSCNVRISEWIFILNLEDVKELLPQNRHHICSLSDCCGTQIHNHLVCKRTLKQLTRLVKWLSCVVSTYLYGASDCISRTCHTCHITYAFRSESTLYICLTVKELLARKSLKTKCSFTN